MKLQKLLDECFDHVISKDESLKFKEFPEAVKSKLSEKHKIALVLGNLNYQWENGGISQWEFNGYAERDFSYIMRLLEQGSTIGIGSCKLIQELLIEFQEIYEDFLEHFYDGEGYLVGEEYKDELAKIDSSYFSIENKLETYEQLLNEYEKGNIQVT